MDRSIHDEVKHNVAMSMLKQGLATMAEVAALRGVTRQYMRKVVVEMDLEPRQARQRHLKQVWNKMLHGSS